MLNLTSDFPKAPERTYEGDHVFFEISPQLSKQLREFNVKHGITMYMLILAAYQLLLFRHTGQDDVVVGSPIANRRYVVVEFFSLNSYLPYYRRSELHSVIGFFANTVALRTHFSRSDTVMEVLQRIRNTTLEAYDNQDVPFDIIL